MCSMPSVNPYAPALKGHRVRGRPATRVPCFLSLHLRQPHRTPRPVTKVWSCTTPNGMTQWNDTKSAPRASGNGVVSGPRRRAHGLSFRLQVLILIHTHPENRCSQCTPQSPHIPQNTAPHTLALSDKITTHSSSPWKRSLIHS